MGSDLDLQTLPFKFTSTQLVYSLLMIIKFVIKLFSLEHIIVQLI